MKKVLLCGINAKYIQSNLAIRYLKKYLDSHSSLCENIIYESTINNSLDEIIEEIFNLKPNILAFSVYIRNVVYVERLIIEMKKLLPEVVIILGGPEVTYRTEDLFDRYSEIDYIICGEGEKALWTIISGNNVDNSNIASRNKLVHIIKNDFDFNETIFPYNNDDMEMLKNRIIYYESSRGCPFGCTYCLSSIEKNVKYLSLERVKKELQFFLDQNVPLVKFVDRTFNLNEERTLDIWKYLVENNNGITIFHFEIFADILTDKMIEFLKSVPEHLFQFEIGIQSTNVPTLRACNRNFNAEKTASKISKLGKNVHTHLDLIAGLPFEGQKEFSESFNYTFNLKPNNLQLGFLKIISGTEMSKRACEYEMLYKSYPPYEVMSTRWMDFDFINTLKKLEKILDMLYNSGKFSQTFMLVAAENPFENILRLLKYFYDDGFFIRPRREEQAVSLLAKYVKNECSELVMEILRYEYIKAEKRSQFPEWYSRSIDKTRLVKMKNKMPDINGWSKHKSCDIEDFKTNPKTHKAIKTTIFFDYLTGKEEIVED